MYLVYHRVIYNTSIYYMRDHKNLIINFLKPIKLWESNKIMGVEVKGAGEGVVIADRGSDCCNNHSGWGSGWGAVGGALVGGGFGAAAVSVWDKINDTNADIRDSRDQMGAGFNRVMDRLCQMEHQQSDCCCEIKGLVRESENRLALQAERNHCEVMKGQQEIKCLIENTAKDQEIARLNRVVDAQRDQNIITQVVAALKGTTTPAQ